MMKISEVTSVEELATSGALRGRLSAVSFPQLLKQIMTDADFEPIPGVLAQGRSLAVANSDAVRDLDGLPFPDFDSYAAGLP